jgi:hypothetical protein
MDCRDAERETSFSIKLTVQRMVGGQGFRPLADVLIRVAGADRLSGGIAEPPKAPAAHAGFAQTAARGQRRAGIAWAGGN